jgi:hypothetical protein
MEFAMDYFEQRIGRSQKDFLVDLIEAFNKSGFFHVLVPSPAGQIDVSAIANIGLNTTGTHELMRLVKCLHDELAAANCADEMLARLKPSVSIAQVK